jgi:small subunit ribosomal protein S16
MVVIRLARTGTRNTPKYRINVADQRRSRGGRYIETIGYFNPNPFGKEEGLILDVPKAEEWISKGAQPSETVRSLIRKMKAMPPKAETTTQKTT